MAHPHALLVLVAVVAGAVYFGYRTSQPAMVVVSAPPTIVIGRGDVQQTVPAPGQLVAWRDLTLSFGIAG